MREAKATFAGYFYFYSGYGNKCDLQYSTNGGGTWTTMKTWDTYGSPADESVALPAGGLGQANVMLRWDRYTTSYPYYYAVVDTVEMVCSLDAAAFDDIPVTFGDPEQTCGTGVGEVKFTVTNTGDRDLLDRPGQPEFAMTVYAINGAPVSVLSIVSGVGAGQIPGAAPLNGSASASLAIPVGGTDVVTVKLGFPSGIGNTGALVFDTKVWVDVNPYNGQINTGELFEFKGDPKKPTELPCLPTVDPNRQLGKQVHLPILNFLGNDDACTTWIEVQAVGPLPVKAVLVTWGEPGFCPPQAAGPLKVECTGLLRPGSTWNLMEDQIPTGSKSGMLFQFTAKQLLEIGVDLGFDDVVADYMCEQLFFGVVGDADDYRRFKKAYNEGLEWRAVPMDKASGDGILAVDVHRTCPADVTAGAKVTSKYNGIAAAHLGAYDPVYGGFTYYVPLVYADRADFNTWIYIQNGGLECSSVEIWMKAQDDCLRAMICEVSTLAPGETIQIDPNQCVGPGWQGSAWIRTSEPMGIAVDIVGRDVLMTYIGEPAELNYTFDPGSAAYTQGNQVAFGPLVYSEYQGWDSGIQVQNLSPIVAAKVKVYFLDRSGDVITTLVDWICPRGSQTFFLPVVHDLPGNWVGSVRVESQEWITPGGPNVAPPNIVAVATLIKYSDALRTLTREAIAYNLLPEHKIFDWQIGYGGGGLDNGVGLIAIPSLLADLDGTGLTSELAIANVVPKPGFTDFVIYIYDQNGLLDYVCQKLNEKQVEYIDLQTWGYINNGFKGSAIISAFFWEHDVFAGDGRFLRNLLGLGAVAVERSKTPLGTDIAGDEAAGDRGIPFRRSDVKDAKFEFGFSGPLPSCPGLPDNRPKAGECTQTPDGDVRHQYQLGAANPNGGPLQYIIIPGANSVPNGGVCGPAIPGVNPMHNWGATELTVCKTSGDFVVTLNAWSLAPYTGASCGWSTHINALLYSVPVAGIILSDGCANLVQDAATTNLGGGFLTTGSIFTFTSEVWVNGPGVYTFASMNGCDTTGISGVTGFADWTLDLP